MPLFGTRGKSKGRFIKQKVKLNIDKFVERSKGKQGRRVIKKQPIQYTVRNEISNGVKKKNYQVFHGRRIVDMSKMANDLWCKNCDIPLSLLCLLKEKVVGVVSKCLVQCYKCNSIIEVETSSKKASGQYYDSNLKLALSTTDAGLGETKLNTFISGMNIPAVNATSLKLWERYVGVGIEKLAQKSCADAIEEEKKLTLEFKRKNNESVGDGDIVDLTASFDTAWPKKGRQYNSLSGHASLIGEFSKKVIGAACRNIYCRKCKQFAPKNHDCRKNHTTSSKSMEADMAVELVLKNNNLVKSKCRIKTIIGDDDSSAIAALRRLSPYAILKWSDFNHTTKTFNGKLYDIKINATLREYFKKVFALCIKKNKGNEVQVKVALSNIIPHVYGDHSHCGEFCKKDDENQHVYRYFKDGKCLTDLNLKEKLVKILQPFINSAAQIAPCGSSQANESFNNIVCSKHPKSAFYGGSESHCVRVAISVCQKNIGYEFVVYVNVHLNLSPGKYTQEFRKRKQEAFQVVADKRKTIPFKKRRLVLKQERSSQNVCQSNREGVTYQSGAGYLDTSDLIDEVVIADQVTDKDCCIVTFDTETTGLSSTDEIVQIAAACGDDTFEVYMLPRKTMSEEASRITGIKIIDNEVWVGENKVASCSPREGFLKFLHFLKSQKKPCILLAHNGFRFDAPRIIRLAVSLDLLKEMNIFVKGFNDTLPIFKSLLLNRKKEKKSFSQSALAIDLLSPEDIKVAHNALNDVLMLQKLVKKICEDETCIRNDIRSINFIQEGKKRTEAYKLRANTMSDLKITQHMRNKIAKAGIDKAILQKAFESGGIEGLTTLLGMSVDGKPRVTMNKKIIKCIFNDLKT